MPEKPRNDTDVDAIKAAGIGRTRSKGVESGVTTREFYERKVPHYQEARTPEVIDMVRQCLPRQGRLLDVGCGTGNLLSEFQEQASFLAGVDISSEACALAREVADVVLNGTIEGDDFSFEEHTFDVVVCADILEHLVHPEVAIAKAIQWCRPEGTVIVSVPNIAYWQARVRLFRGIWTYEETGIFDEGHLRFFTYASLLSFLETAGLVIVDYRPVLQPLWRHVRGLHLLPAAVLSPLEREWVRLGTRRPSLFARQHVYACRLIA